MLKKVPPPFARAQNGSRQRSAETSRRRSRASAAVPSRSPSFRRSRAPSPSRSQRRCVSRDPPCRIVRDGKLLLDCRTLADGEIDEVSAAVRACR